MSNMTKRRAEEVLELTGTYTKGDLRKAFAKQARFYHPDVARQHGIDEENANELMGEVNAAFKYLSEFFKDDPNAKVTASPADENDYAASGVNDAYDSSVYNDPAPASTSYGTGYGGSTSGNAYAGSSSTGNASDTGASTGGGYTYDDSRVKAARERVDAYDREHGTYSGYEDVFKQWDAAQKAAETKNQPPREPGPIGRRLDRIVDKVLTNPIMAFVLNPIVLRILFPIVLFVIWRRIGQFEPFSWDTPLLEKGVFGNPVAYLVTMFGYFVVPAASIYNFATGLFTDALTDILAIAITLVCFPVALVMHVLGIGDDGIGKSGGASVDAGGSGSV